MGERRFLSGFFQAVLSIKAFEVHRSVTEPASPEVWNDRYASGAHSVLAMPPYESFKSTIRSSQLSTSTAYLFCPLVLGK